MLNRSAKRFHFDQRQDTQGRQHLKCDEYLAAGYPIGIGVSEEACRLLVKDRTEMRWTVPGAQAMLHLRAPYTVGLQHEYVNDHIEAQQTRLCRRSAA